MSREVVRRFNEASVIYRGIRAALEAEAAHRGLLQ